MFYFVPKGFFPVQDTGAILGISEAPQSVSFAQMADRQQALAKVILQDPGVESLSSFIGVDGTNITPNSGRIQITLKPLEDRDANASAIIRRLQPKLAQIPGICCTYSRFRISRWKTASAAHNINTRSSERTRKS